MFFRMATVEPYDAAAGNVLGNQPLAPLTDTSKLKKHISVVCERLARGGSLTSGGD